MLKSLLTLGLLACFTAASAQLNYTDSLKSFRATYVNSHEAVKGSDRAKLQFYEVDPALRVFANFEPVAEGKWIELKSSGPMKQRFREYGILRFKIGDSTLHLSVYQSQGLIQVEGYQDYLFLPFLDRTAGSDTYEGGRYIDLKTGDIINNQLLLDFNKAYNPYCAYAGGVYSCPLPPAGNVLPVSIRAGEKAFPH